MDVKKTLQNKPEIIITTKDITCIAMIVAIIEACKIVMASIPNVELTTFWVVLFSLCMRRQTLFAIPIFILIEGAMYGFGLWWVMYLYSWPLLSFFAWKMRNMKSALSWSIFSGIFGLCFGALCSIPYFIIGTASEGLRSGLTTGFAWWIAGIPFDLIHGVSNFFLMLALYHPVRRILNKWSSFY